MSHGIVTQALRRAQGRRLRKVGRHNLLAPPVIRLPIRCIKPGMMRILLLLPMAAFLLPAAALAAPPAAPPARPAADPQSLICATNPAYSLTIMRTVIDEELAKENHDPSLDNEPPDRIAVESMDQGIGECATALRQDPDLMAELSSLKGADVDYGWDAFNTACDGHAQTKGNCIRAEVGAARALKHMSSTNLPPGARTIVESCQLILKSEPTMANWRECVDLGLAAQAPPAAAKRCKLSVNWHMSSNGKEAGDELAACLKLKD